MNKKISKKIVKRSFVGEKHPVKEEVAKEEEKEILSYHDEFPIEGEVTAKETRECSFQIEKVKKEVAKVIVGQGNVINGLIRGLLCGGHVLLEGIPGIAKTLAILALGSTTGCIARRIQFTVDLLPSDIVGITTYTPGKGFETVKGPIFANFIIADEINRSPPKTQSALLEAMQEKKVTIGKETYQLPLPFFVMATENPIETSGVYMLPEAQVDRFLFKVMMGYPEREDEKVIMKTNVTLRKFEDFNLQAVISPRDIDRMQSIVKRVYLSPEIEEYIMRIIDKTRLKDHFEMNKYIEWGASPRAAIGLFIASKAEALLKGRNFVKPQDIKNVAFDVLRHRIILKYMAEAEGINSDRIIQEILDTVEIP
jgi:MoxR-like ATPase